MAEYNIQLKDGDNLLYPQTLIENVSGLEDELSTIENGISNVIGADEWDKTKSYKVGDYVAYNDKLYRCKIAIGEIAPTVELYWEEINLSTLHATTPIYTVETNSIAQLSDVNGKNIYPKTYTESITYKDTDANLASSLDNWRTWKPWWYIGGSGSSTTGFSISTLKNPKELMLVVIQIEDGVTVNSLEKACACSFCGTCIFPIQKYLAYNTCHFYLYGIGNVFMYPAGSGASTLTFQGSAGYGALVYYR